MPSDSCSLQKKGYALRRRTRRIVNIDAHQIKPDVAMIAQPKFSTAIDNRPRMPPINQALKNVIAARRLAHLT